MVSFDNEDRSKCAPTKFAVLVWGMKGITCPGMTLCGDIGRVLGTPAASVQAHLSFASHPQATAGLGGAGLKENIRQK